MERRQLSIFNPVYREKASGFRLYFSCHEVLQRLTEQYEVLTQLESELHTFS